MSAPDKCRRGVFMFFVVAVLVACSGTGRSVRDPVKAAEANAELGLAYMQQGRLELAMDKLQSALELDSGLPQAHHYIAELYQRTGDEKLADKHYRKALTLAPEEPMLHNNYGVFLCRQRRYREAEDHFLEAAGQVFYRSPEVAYKNAGACAYHAGDPDKAEQYYRKALQLKPRLAAALIGMAELKENQGAHLSARAFLQRYEEVARVTPRSLWLGVKVERALGDDKAAAAYAAKLRRRFPAAAETARLEKLESP
ncbi:MAG TPA: type IV pilus biogenesis/stability protein PilW [Gammaproteobacteria bacterium]|nr:type IV pilus biogenesis/stability protein PilW [Gammaproteobacteria bacterium]